MIFNLAKQDIKKNNKVVENGSEQAKNWFKTAWEMLQQEKNNIDKKRGVECEKNKN